MKYLFIIIFIFIIGCSAHKYFTSEGEKLYYEKCGGCHRPYPKSELKTEEWKMKMEEMDKRTKLNGEEKRLILLYLSN